MSHFEQLQAIYPESSLRRAGVQRERKSKLDAHKSFIDNWLDERIKAENKQRFSQRSLARILKSTFELNVSQAALSRYFKKHRQEGFFHE